MNLSAKHSVTALCGSYSIDAGTAAYLVSVLLNLDNMLPQLLRILDSCFRFGECFFLRIQLQRSAVEVKSTEVHFGSAVRIHDCRVAGLRILRGLVGSRRIRTRPYRLITSICNCASSDEVGVSAVFRVPSTKSVHSRISTSPATEASKVPSTNRLPAVLFDEVQNNDVRISSKGSLFTCPNRQSHRLPTHPRWAAWYASNVIKWGTQLTRELRIQPLSTNHRVLISYKLAGPDTL